MTEKVSPIQNVRPTISRDRVPAGAKHCQAEDFAFGGAEEPLVVRELTEIEFADWQQAAETAGAGPMHTQIGFVGLCLCREDLSPVGYEVAGSLPRTVAVRAVEMALRLNGLSAGEAGGKKKS